MTHAHMTTWFLALVLFLVAFFLHKGGKAKGAKIVKMVLRVFYLLILGTGFMLFTNSGYSGEYIFKVIMGIVVIGFMEMILGKTTKNQSTKVFWIFFIIAFVLTLFLGFRLPM